LRRDLTRTSTKIGPPSLGNFLLRTFLWLPPCFAAWYFSAQPHGAVAGRVALLIVDQLRPRLVPTLERSGVDLVFVTTLEVHPAPGVTGMLLPQVNPLIYTYGLALFVALMLATRAKWWKLFAGIFLLLPFQGWGIALDFLVQVAVMLGPEVSAQVGLLGWRREAIALGYQVGTLILPALVPVALWALFSAAFIEGMVRRRVTMPSPEAQ